MGVELKIVRVPGLSDLGRYYAESHTIVLRAGMLLEQERATLWHERRHALRRDVSAHNDANVERVVEMHAAEDAMPWVSIEWAWGQAQDLTEMASLLKLPEEFVYFRLKNLHPARLAQLRLRVDQFA